MSSINTSIIATRLRVAKNFSMLIAAGVESSVAVSIVMKFSKLSFNLIRIADDKVVICYNTCSTKHSIDFSIAA